MFAVDRRERRVQVPSVIIVSKYKPCIISIFKKERKKKERKKKMKENKSTTLGCMNVSIIMYVSLRGPVCMRYINQVKLFIWTQTQMCII